MSHPSSARKCEGNPVHIAKVKEISRSTFEKINRKLPDALRRTQDKEKLRAVLRDQSGLSQDPLEAAIARALGEAAFEDRNAWPAWRATFSERLDVSGADFSGLLFLQARFDNAKMVGVNFDNSHLNLCNFTNSDLEGASFVRAKMSAPSFAGAKLTRADFSGALLEAPSVDSKTDFTGAIFTDCELRPYVDGSGVDRVKSFRSQLSAEQQKQIKQLKTGCFIATAACGDVNAWEVLTLREFRDRVLTASAIGRLFVEAYYMLSPPFAGFISQWPLLRVVARTVLIRPLAHSAQRLMQRKRPNSRG